MHETLTAAVAIGGLVCAVVAIVLIQRRYRRLRKRIDRLERRGNELLHIVKSLEAQSMALRVSKQQSEVRMPMVCRATGGEDLWLLELFNPPGARVRTDGFYIECGGFDGLNKSVTWMFDALGWNGLLIEPLPHLAEAARQNRPNARVVQAAVAERGSTGTAKFVHVAGEELGFEGSSHLAGAGEGSVKRAPMDGAKETQVPLTCMDVLLKDHSGPIDLVVLDVEGAEPRVLDGLDLNRFRPRVLLIEDHTLGSDGDRSEIMRRLGPAGYRHITWIGRNRLVIHGDEAALIARAGDLAQASAVRRAVG